MPLVEEPSQTSTAPGLTGYSTTPHGASYSLADTRCTECVSGKLVFNQFKDGDYKGVRYIGCNHFPRCRHFEWVQ